jgi:hypothetical protein
MDGAKGPEILFALCDEKGGLVVGQVGAGVHAMGAESKLPEEATTRSTVEGNKRERERESGRERVDKRVCTQESVGERVRTRECARKRV